MLGYQIVAWKWRNEEYKKEERQWNRRCGKAEIKRMRNGDIRYKTIEWKYNGEMKGRQKSCSRCQADEEGAPGGVDCAVSIPHRAQCIFHQNSIK
jgi:hypothetical protein